MTTEERLISTCLERGAANAALLTTDRIPFDRSLRAYCEANSCGSFGRNYACPPHVGEPDELIARAQSYSHALLFQTIAELEDSFDFEGMAEAGKTHAAVCDRIFAALMPGYARCLPLTAGGCSICATCAAVEGKPCRFPDRAVSSLEAYCMHVAKLCGRCGMKYINGADTVTYFGMLLFDMPEE